MTDSPTARRATGCGWTTPRRPRSRTCWSGAPWSAPRPLRPTGAHASDSLSLTFDAGNLDMLAVPTDGMRNEVGLQVTGSEWTKHGAAELEAALRSLGEGAQRSGAGAADPGTKSADKKSFWGFFKK